MREQLSPKKRHPKRYLLFQISANNINILRQRINRTYTYSQARSNLTNYNLSARVRCLSLPKIYTRSAVAGSLATTYTRRSSTIYLPNLEARSIRSSTLAAAANPQSARQGDATRDFDRVLQRELETLYLRLPLDVKCARGGDRERERERSTAPAHPGRPRARGINPPIYLGFVLSLSLSRFALLAARRNFAYIHGASYSTELVNDFSWKFMRSRRKVKGLLYDEMARLVHPLRCCRKDFFCIPVLQCSLYFIISAVCLCSVYRF